MKRKKRICVETSNAILFGMFGHFHGFEAMPILRLYAHCSHSIRLLIQTPATSSWFLYRFGSVWRGFGISFFTINRDLAVSAFSLILNSVKNYSQSGG